MAEHDVDELTDPIEIEQALADLEPPTVRTSPRRVTSETQMDFPAAVREIAIGRKVRRVAWADTNQPDAYIWLRDEKLSLCRQDGSIHTLIVTDGDLRGTDWVVVREH